MKKAPIYNPQRILRRPQARPRPGRYVPQFEGMRVEHDDHKRRWLQNIYPNFLYGHWTDCDTCLALYIYDETVKRNAGERVRAGFLLAFGLLWISLVVLVAMLLLR